SYTYTPAANFSGADSFTYTVSDANGGVSTYTVAVMVSAVNDVPVASDVALATDTDVPLAGHLPVAADDDLDAISYILVGAAGHGLARVDADGHYSYIPTPGYSGTDSFSYAVDDGRGGRAVYSVNVQVAPAVEPPPPAPNHAPVAADATLATQEDQAAPGRLPGATDADGDPVSYALASPASHGTVTMGADGSYRYTPAPDYAGPDRFSYTVDDGRGGSSRHDVAITVAAVNDAPVTSPVTLAPWTEDGGPRHITQAELLAGASDIDLAAGTALRAVDLAITSGGGELVAHADGSWTYLPDADANGNAGFSYRVSDGAASTAASASLTRTPVNDAPVAADATATLAEDTRLSAQLPAARDVDGDPVSYRLASAPAHGTLTLDTRGTWVYNPAAGYHGADSFSYTVDDGQGGSSRHSVAITVTPVNDLPSWPAPAPATTAGDTAVSGRLPAATDADGDTLVYARASAPAHGSASVAADGTWVYTPAAGYHGADSFQVSVDDGHGGVVLRTVDINVLAAPAIELPAASDLGVSASDRITSAPVITLAGQAEAGLGLRIYGPQGQLLGEVVADAQGRWSVAGIRIAQLQGDDAGRVVGAPGAYTFSVRLQLPDGREGAPSRLTVQREIPPSLQQDRGRDSADDTRSSSADTTGVHGSDAAPQRRGSGSGELAPEHETPAPTHEAEPHHEPRNGTEGDIYTRPSGFQVMVTPAAEPALKLFNGVADQIVPLDRHLMVQVPADAFVHTVLTETITLSATQADGQPLPSWLSFDGRSGKFVGEPPAGKAQDLAIAVTARDSAGREATTMFRIKVTDGRSGASSSSRTGLGQQLARGEALVLKPGQGHLGWHSQPRDLAAGPAQRLAQRHTHRHG
ncbi:MAG: hypothetical protein RLZZ584_2359, partial [Pseudomonadota bacterium]